MAQLIPVQGDPFAAPDAGAPATSSRLVPVQGDPFAVPAGGPQAFSAAFAPQNVLPLLKASSETVQRSLTPETTEAQPRDPNAFGTGVLQGTTFGFGDELMAGALSPIEMAVRAYRGEDAGKGPLDRLGSAYDAALDRERGVLKRAETDHPVAETLGNIAGGLATGGALTRGGVTLLQGAPTVAKAAGEGAIYGGLQGLGEGEGLQDRLKGAAKGGAIGGAIGGVVGRIAETLASRNMMDQIPTTDDLRTAAQQAYGQADQAGLVLRPQGLQTLSQDIQQTLANGGYLPRLHTRIAATLDEINNVAGQNVTLRGVDVLRRVANNARMSVDPSEARLGGQVVDHIDDYLNNLTPADVLMGDPAGVDALREARQLWSSTRKSETVEDAVTRATRRADSTGSGGNSDNAIRQNIRAILDNPRRAAGFTADELAAMEQVVRGTGPQNLARLIGKLSPEGNGLNLLLGIGGTLAAPTAAPLIAGAGFIGKRLADAATPANVRIVEALIRNGGHLPAQQLTGAQQAVADALVHQGGQRAPAIGMPQR